jgi:hypothetical protein
MTNIFDFIARDDGAQERLVDEINSTFPGKMEADWIPPNSDLVNMPFLNAVSNPQTNSEMQLCGNGDIEDAISDT